LIRNASANATKIHFCVFSAREVRQHEADRVPGPLLGAEHRGGPRGGQHQQRADQRVDDELERRRHAVGAAPDADQEVERNQHQVEEQDEQREVLCDERAEHGGLGEPEVEAVQAPAALRRAQSGPQRGRREQQCRQPDEPQVQPVDPELVADPQIGDPGVVGDVLQAGLRRVEVDQQEDRVGERDERADDRRRPREPARQHAGDHGDRERPEQQDREVDGHDAESRK
jgi:hypothetical protein